MNSIWFALGALEVNFQLVEEEEAPLVTIVV